MGRRKIDIKKIQNQGALNVTFSKRRTGVFKKAGELCILSGCEATVIVFSPAGNPFLFGHPDGDAVVRRFLDSNTQSDAVVAVPPGQTGAAGEDDFWFLDAPVEKMGLNELEKLKSLIEEQIEKVADRVEEMAMAAVSLECSENGAGSSSSSSTCTTMVEYAPPQEFKSSDDPPGFRF